MAINLSTLFGAMFLFILPVLYQKYLAKKEFLISFYLSQIVYITAVCLTLCLALQLNKHVPDIVLFVICGPLAAVMEKMMTALPSNMIMSRVIPHGVEAVMFSLAHTIMNLNMFQLRTMMGVLINKITV